jgi:DnaJ like chaperone protein
MAKYVKWIGGGLGWALFGPIGGILGFVLGSFIDYDETPYENMSHRPTTKGDFAVSLLVLIAAILKADGKVYKSELDYVKRYFIRTFGESSAREAMLLLRDILKQPISLKDVATQAGEKLDYSSKLQMLHLLFDIANADRNININELNLLQQVADYMHINPQDFQSIKSMYYSDLSAAYSVLEISETATDEEVRKAYRNMALKYHPDKVEYLGEDMKKIANERFKKVNEAYERIKKARGMN